MRRNYRRYIQNIKSEYFELKYGLFALNDFEDGVYHLLDGTFHHLISIKIKDINGNVLTLTKNHSFQLQLTCGDYVTNGGGSSIKGTARYLGGTQ